MAETQYFAKSSGFTSDHFYTDSVDGSPHFSSKNGWSTSTGTIIQGSMAKPEVFGSDYNANYYGLMFLKDGAGNNAFDAIRTANTNNAPNYIRVRIHSQYSATKTVYLHLGSGISYNSFASGSRPVDCAGCGAKTLSIPANGWGEIIITDAAWLAELASTSTVCLYINHYPSGHSPDSGYYFEGDGALDGANAYQVFVDWTPRGPRLSDPVVGTIDPIHDSPHTFLCGASSDLGGFFTPDQLTYEMQFAPDGNTWGATISSALGNPSFSNVNLKTLLGLQDKQYYFNTAACIRVRAKTPAWTDGKYYYSHENWADVPVSSPFTIDYRIVPSAPYSLVRSKPEPFEGESITFTAQCPVTYNAQNHLGAAMLMNYFIELVDDGTPLASGGVNVPNTKIINYVVDNLTIGMNDRATTIRAKCIDAENQVGPYFDGVTFKIQRFRAPVILITGIERAETSAVIHFRIIDTGYGGNQVGGQIGKVQYNHDGSYHDAVLGVWGGPAGLDNAFTIMGLAAGVRYSLNIRAINSVPQGTALLGKTGNISTDTILSYLPMSYNFNRSGATGTQAKEGLATQALVVGNNYDDPVDAGCGKFQYDVTLGRYVYVIADSGRIIMNRPAGGVGQYAGVRFVDNVTTKAFLGYDFNWQHLVGSEDGNVTFNRLILGTPVAGKLGIFDTNGWLIGAAPGTDYAKMSRAPDKTWTSPATGTSVIDTSTLAPAIAITDNEVYWFEFYALPSASSTTDIKIGFNGTALGTSNYDSAYEYSGSDGSGNNFLAWSNNTGKLAIAWGFIKKIGGYICCWGEGLRGGTTGSAKFFIRKLAAGDLTSIQITAAASVKSGAVLNMWKI